MLVITSVVVLMVLTYVLAVIRCRKVYEMDAAMLRRFYQMQLNDYINKDDWIVFNDYKPRKVGFYFVLAEGIEHYCSRVHKAIYSTHLKRFIDEQGQPVNYKVAYWKPISAKPKPRAAAI